MITPEQALKDMHPADRLGAMFGAPPAPDLKLRLMLKDLARKPELCPEARTLIDLAIRAQESGQMPDLSSIGG